MELISGGMRPAIPALYKIPRVGRQAQLKHTVAGASTSLKRKAAQIAVGLRLSELKSTDARPIGQGGGKIAPRIAQIRQRGSGPHHPMTKRAAAEK